MQISVVGFTRYIFFASLFVEALAVVADYRGIER
jgi:hypothetical protein